MTAHEEYPAMRPARAQNQGTCMTFDCSYATIALHPIFQDIIAEPFRCFTRPRYKLHPIETEWVILLSLLVVHLTMTHMSLPKALWPAQ